MERFTSLGVLLLIDGDVFSLFAELCKALGMLRVYCGAHGWVLNRIPFDTLRRRKLYGERAVGASDRLLHGVVCVMCHACSV